MDQSNTMSDGPPGRSDTGVKITYYTGFGWFGNYADVAAGNFPLKRISFNTLAAST